MMYTSVCYSASLSYPLHHHFLRLSLPPSATPPAPNSLSFSLHPVCHSSSLPLPPACHFPPSLCLTSTGQVVLSGQTVTTPNIFPTCPLQPKQTGTDSFPDRFHLNYLFIPYWDKPQKLNPLKKLISVSFSVI